MKKNKIAVVGNNDELAYKIFLNLTSTIDGVEFFNSKFKNEIYNKTFDFIIYGVINENEILNKEQYQEILNLSNYTNQIILLSEINKNKNILSTNKNMLELDLIKKLNKQLTIVKINHITRLSLLSQLILNEKIIQHGKINFIFEKESNQGVSIYKLNNDFDINNYKHDDEYLYAIMNENLNFIATINYSYEM